MIYKKDYKIKGKIVEKEDLIKLANEIINKFTNKEISLKIVANFNDNSSIESGDINIFEDDYFDKKILTSVLIDMFVDEMRHRIYIYLSSINGTIIVSSDDKNTYDSLCHCIEEKIKLSQNQSFIYIFSAYPILYAMFYMFIFVSSLFMANIIQTNFNITLKFPFILILIISSCSLFYLYKFSKYFPIIQFDFGEESLNRPKKPKCYLLRLIIPIIFQYLLAILIPYFTSLLIR